MRSDISGESVLLVRDRYSEPVLLTRKNDGSIWGNSLLAESVTSLGYFYGDSSYTTSSQWYDSNKNSRLFITVNESNLLEAREVYNDGRDGMSEFPIFSLDSVSFVSAASKTCAFIDTTGELWIWGENQCGEIGDDFSLPRTFDERYNTLSNVADCAVGEDIHHYSSGGQTYQSGSVIALTENGDIYTWGNNDYGQLGTGDTELCLTPTKIMSVR
jgi:hypothetical protein